MNTTNLFLQAMRTYLNNGPVLQALSEQEWDGLYNLAKKHDVAQVLDVPGISGETAIRLRQARLQAVYRYERQNADYLQICSALQSAGIDYLPLKGSIIRAFYPQPWHRTSCDIDILVRDSDVDRARSLLTEALGYTFEKNTNHDVSFMTPAKTHLELHYCFEEQHISEADIWRQAVPVASEDHQYRMSWELFVFCHIAHMAKHFSSGGCGFRPFLDLMMLERGVSYDRTGVFSMLEQNGLLKFGETIFALTEVWFSGREPDALLKSAADYILQAGVYGSTENKVAIQQAQKQSKKAYFLNRIFQPYEAMRYPYPILDKHRWMLPLCQIHRWWKLLFCGKARKVFRELRIGAEMDDRRRNAVSALLQDLGL